MSDGLHSSSSTGTLAGSAGPGKSEEGWVKLSEKTYMCNSRPLKNDKHVYKGKHLLSGEWIDVAVKLIPPDEANFSEINLHLKLRDHPNVIRLYEADKTQGIIPLVYIAMELCSQSLADFVEEGKSTPLDFKQRFDFAKQILSGVIFIHKCNILHRDIKLENILLSESKESIRVADFGLSKQLLDERSFATASNRGLGSDGYRAPELVHDNPKASYRSDSFSLGIVLAMLFSNGHHPFGLDPARWRINIMDNTGKDLSHVLTFEEPFAEKRAQLLDLINRCLHPNYKRRPTPAEMLQHPFFTSNSGSPTELNQVTEELKKATISTDAKSSANTEEPQSFAGSETPASLTQLQKSADAKATEPFNETGITDIPTDVKGAVSTGPLDEFLIAKQRKIKDLENQMGASLMSGDTERYSLILKELKRLRENDDLDIAIQLAEYELMSCKNISPDVKLYNYISTSRSRSLMEVAQMGVHALQEGRNVQAMLYMKLSYDLHKAEGKFPTEEECKWIVAKAGVMVYAANELMKQSGSWHDCVKFGLKCNEEMIVDLDAVKGLSAGEKVVHEMNLMVGFTGLCNDLHEYEKGIKYGEERIARMKEAFGDDVLFYRNYGAVMNNLGNAYGRVGQPSKRDLYYQIAMEGHEKALDYDSEDTRQEHIRQTRANMKN